MYIRTQGLSIGNHNEMNKRGWQSVGLATLEWVTLVESSSFGGTARLYTDRRS